MARITPKPRFLDYLSQAGLFIAQLNLGYMATVAIQADEPSPLIIGILTAAVVFVGWLSVRGMQAVTGSVQLIDAAARFRAAGNDVVGPMRGVEPAEGEWPIEPPEPSAAPDQLTTDDLEAMAEEAPPSPLPVVTRGTKPLRAERRSPIALPPRADARGMMDLPVLSPIASDDTRWIPTPAPDELLEDPPAPRRPLRGERVRPLDRHPGRPSQWGNE